MAFFTSVALLCGITHAQDPAAQPGSPQQVTVSVKVIEFQATKGVETGLSAYFKRIESRMDWFGVVKPVFQGMKTADVTFPAKTIGGLTVFLDNIKLTEGDIEMVLQALVDENRATIVSEPSMTFVIGPEKHSIVTAQKIPFENTVVVGATVTQITEFRPTGVTLEASAPSVIDVDGDWYSNEDTFIKLDLKIEVSEEGQRIVVALDNETGTDFTESQNAIQVPEFVSRSITTSLYVRNRQVLIMGGLYNNSETRSGSSVPWLAQGEDIAVGFAERVIPGDFVSSPVSSVLGKKTSNLTRRELVFFIKAEVWRPPFLVADPYGFSEQSKDETEVQKAPADIITNVLRGITDTPREIGEEIRRRTTPEDQDGIDLGGGGQ